MTYGEYCNKLINKLILHGRKFVEYSCFRYGMFKCDKKDNYYMIKILVLFVNTKLFENIVTVEGEEFYNQREEKECYKLVKELTQFVYIELDRLSKIDSKTANEELNKHMKKMFKNMKKSLEEEIGSINKEFLKSDK